MLYRKVQGKWSNTQPSLCMSHSTLSVSLKLDQPLVEWWSNSTMSCVCISLNFNYLCLFVFISYPFRHGMRVTSLICILMLHFPDKTDSLTRVEGSFHQPNWLQLTFDKVANQSSREFPSMLKLYYQTSSRWPKRHQIRKKGPEIVYTTLNKEMN